MAKPFKITTPGDPGVMRGAGGRFIPATPAEIQRQATQSGQGVVDVLRENHAPEHPTPGARPGVAEERPWPATQPPRRHPMRIK
jgi:hypothetical protein